jgi:hypothetical protein
MSDEVKLSSHAISSEIQPDWGMLVNNQLTIITQQSAMLENQRLMIENLQRIADPSRFEQALKQQVRMIESIDHLAVQMDTAREELEMAVGKLSSSVMGILQAPIAVAVIGVASWAFFFKYIEEWTWLLLMAVAAFRYLGDSITAVAKLFGLEKKG